MSTKATKTPRKREETENIADAYRRLLRKPKLSQSTVEETRKHVQAIALAVCEHVWGKKFH
jgi:hypothetical protein